MAWYGEPLIGFDLETTGTDPLEARIVTAAVVRVGIDRPAGPGGPAGPAGQGRPGGPGGPAAPVDGRVWLADPGVRIPAQASAIHGISSERASAEGRPAREVADEVAQALSAHWSAGVPVVAYNAAFDLTLLTAELRRYGLPSLGDRLDGRPIGPVIDPYTIDRAVDRFRKGKRNLEAVCAEYGIALTSAHDATSDAVAAVRVARALAGRHPSVGALSAGELHERQIRWYAEWAKDFQAFLRRKGNPDAVVEASWPLKDPVLAAG
ncbi:exonuclease domain-containing protein [Streptomyces sp. NPDC055078]